MPLGGLQHFTIEPQDLEHTKNFYVDVLGLEIGDRPPLDFPATGSIPAARPPCT
jgi:catechol 2,3-dioxygenase-like lactoylglutathione lyase family enzyme